MAFPDVEVALIEYLSDLGYCVTSTPADLKSRLPVLRIQRIGGGNTKTDDQPRVSVQAFVAADYLNPRAALDLADAVRNRLTHDLPAITAAGRLDTSETDSGPVKVPWPDVEVNVVQAVYRLTTRA